MSIGYYDQVEQLLRDCFAKNRGEPGCLYAAGELMMMVGTKPAQEAARSVWAQFVAVAPDHLRANYVRSELDQLNARLGPPSAAPKRAAPPPSQPASQPASRPAAAPTETAPEQPSGNAVDPAVPGHAQGPQGRDVGELNPFGVAIQKAMVAIRNNDAPGAESAYREALEIRPNDASALAGLSEAQFSQRRIDDAVASIEKAWSIDPSDAQVRWVFDS